MGATVTDHLRLLITASAKGAVSEIKGVTGETEQASVKTRLYQGALQRLGLEGVSSGKMLGAGVAAGAAVGGAALAKFTLDGIGKFASMTNQVDDLQRVLGGSAEDASRVSFAVRTVGIDSGTADTSFFQLAKRIGAGTDTLSNFGAEVGRNKDGTVNMTQTILSMADAYKGIEDPGQRALFLMQNFGKSGKAMGELLEKSRAELKGFFDEAANSHQVFSEADLQAGKDYRIAIRELSSAVEGLKIEAGQQAAPAVTDFANAMTFAIQTTDKAKSSWAGPLVDAVERNVNPMKNLTETVHELTGFFDDGSDSSNKYSDAQKTVQDKTTALANAVADHGAKSKEAKQAQGELSSATKDLQGYQQGLETQLTKTSDALKTHTEKLYEDQQASLGAAGDKIAVGNAVEGVRSKLASLNETLVGNMVANDTSAEAVARAAQGQRDLASSVLATTSAAAKQAVDNLGPNATAQEKMDAASAATKQTLEALYATFPGLKEQVEGYIGTIKGVPATANTTVTADTGPAHAALDTLEARLRVLTGTVWGIGLQIKNAAGGTP